jgi:hypothetical protein
MHEGHKTTKGYLSVIILKRNDRVKVVRRGELRALKNKETASNVVGQTFQI